MTDSSSEDGRFGYAVRYAVAAVAMSRLCPKRLGWWILSRPMFGREGTSL